jgi:hypothetical protein
MKRRNVLNADVFLFVFISAVILLVCYAADPGWPGVRLAALLIFAILWLQVGWYRRGFNDGVDR